MNDSELLGTGYQALSEAHVMAQTVATVIQSKQTAGEAVNGRDYEKQFREIRNRVQQAHCAFMELERRAAGGAPVIKG